MVRCVADIGVNYSLRLPSQEAPLALFVTVMYVTQRKWPEWHYQFLLVAPGPMTTEAERKCRAMAKQSIVEV